MSQSSMRLQKPKLNTRGLIERLKSNGVKFEWTSEEKAIEYLEKNNNYFKLAAYRKNFIKEPLVGYKAPQYINLDFGHLRALAVADMRLRYIMMHMCADVEHALKVRLISEITENTSEDGYSIVDEYRNSLPEDILKQVENELSRTAVAPYCCDLFHKYNGQYPIWAFAEIVPFGRLLDIYKFYCEKYQLQQGLDLCYVLMEVRQLRNAVAHNNCIINDLRPIPFMKTKKNGSSQQLLPRTCVSQGLGKLDISKMQRKKRMTNARMCQVVTLLYAHKELVLSVKVKEHRYAELHELVDLELTKHKEHFMNNDLLLSNYSFFKKVVDAWCPTVI